MQKNRFKALAVLAAFLISGCSSVAVDENDPASLFADAEAEIKSDHYLIAIDKLRVIRNKFPYSKYATEAQLRIADVFFLQESYPEAAASYEAFRDLHPQHEKVGYAMARIGKSYYNEIPSQIARDLTPAYKAQDAYQEYLKRFPGGPDAGEARQGIASIRNQLASKELYIGESYDKRDFYDSAQPRYEKVIELYPETEAAQTAKDKLAQLKKNKGESKASEKK